MSKPFQRSPEPPRCHAGYGACAPPSPPPPPPSRRRSIGTGTARIGQLPSSPATAYTQRNDPANHHDGAAPIACAIPGFSPVP